ncbi:MAG: hypothetical protein ACETWK_01385 [Candidatus Aminicenantaceae bacterium]
MRKTITTVVALILFSGLLSAKGIIFELKGSYFSPSEKAFKDIYGGGITYGGEVTFDMWRNIELWLGGSYFTKKGKLTFTKEETKLELIPLGGGLKFRISKGNVIFYGGAGLHYYQYKESNPIGKTSKGRVGYIGKLGSFVKVSGGLLIDLYVRYSYCKLKPADYKVNIGGIEGGIGLGYEF